MTPGYLEIPRIMWKKALETGTSLRRATVGGNLRRGPFIGDFEKQVKRNLETEHLSRYVGAA